MKDYSGKASQSYVDDAVERIKQNISSSNNETRATMERFVQEYTTTVGEEMATYQQLTDERIAALTNRITRLYVAFGILGVAVITYALY